MRFGTYYFLQAPPALAHAEVFRREIEQMAWTEELGFDSLWLTEHHFIEYGLSVSPTVLAAAAAMRTRRVRIGLAAAILPFHDPIRLAEELAMVDILCGGRLDVGVGRGNRPVEFEGYRVPQIESRERFEEALTILVRAWTLERFAYEGRHYRIPEVRVIPKPLQQPHPPLYVVCVSPDTIEATALRGLPMLNSLLRGPIDQLAQQRDTYVRACRKAGRDDAEIARLLGSWGGRRPRHGRREDRRAAPPRRRRGALLDELRRPAPGARAALDGAVRAGGHAGLPLNKRFLRNRSSPSAIYSASVPGRRPPADPMAL